jgi:hypothetical protein
VTYSVALAWGKVAPTTIANWWKECVGKDDVTEDDKV